MKSCISHVLCFLTINFSSLVFGAEEVSFVTRDGGIVHANFYPAGTTAVVLAHGAVFDKESWSVLADRLAADDIAALAIDFRGYGQSHGGNSAADYFEDILAAVRYLHRQKGFEEVAVLGASMGGGASGNAASHALPDEISRLILLSPASVSSPEKMQAGRILYIASQNEAGISEIQAQFRRAPEPKQLVLLNGRAHAQHIFKTTEKSVLTETVITFLKAH